MAKYINLLPDGNYTTSQVVDITNKEYEPNRGAVIFVNVSRATFNPNMTVTVRGKDRLSNKYYTILTSSLIAASGLTVLRVFPQLTAAANIADDVIPADWGILVTMSGDFGGSYSIGASLV